MGKASGLMLDGFAARKVEVEVTAGNPPTTYDRRVREGLVRVQSALRTVGVERSALTIALPKDVTWVPSLDLAVAVAALVEERRVPYTTNSFAGELSSMGSILPVRGILPLVMAADPPIIVPVSQLPEVARWAQNVRGASTLSEVVGYLTGYGDSSDLPVPVKIHLPDRLPDPDPPPEILGAAVQDLLDSTDNVVLIGPHGSDQIMIALRATDRLPVLDDSAAYEVDVAASLAGLGGPVSSRPFRAPHYTVSHAGLVGLGLVWVRLRPAEIHLAHHGTLFLDELPEFQRGTIEALARALADGQHLGLPSGPRVVASAALCACGWLGSGKSCTCSAEVLRLYQGRLDDYCQILGLRRVSAGGEGS